MNHPHDTEQFFKKVTVETDPSRDLDVLDLVLTAFEKGNPPTASRLRIPIRWTGGRLASIALGAAVIVLAVVVCLSHLGISIDGTTMLYARVREALEKEPWIHITQTILTGDETRHAEGWGSSEHGITAGIVHGVNAEYLDFDLQRLYTYNPDSHTITVSHLTLVTVPSFGSQTVAEMIESLFQRQLGDVEIRRKSVEENGKMLEILEMVGSEPSGTTEIQLVIDTHGYLPMTGTIRTTDPPGNLISQGNIEFDYPESGPEDIYALGVPRDANVVILAAPVPDIVDVVAEYDKRRSRLGDIRAMIIHTEDSHPPKITLIESLRSKRKHRQSNTIDIPENELTEREELVEQLVSNEGLVFKGPESNYLPDLDGLRTIILLNPRMGDLFAGFRWEFDLVDDPTSSGMVGCQRAEQNERGTGLTTWWFDPKNDYWISHWCCSFEASSNSIDPHAISSRTIVHQVTLFRETLGGHLYPGRIVETVRLHTSSKVTEESHYDIYFEEAGYSKGIDRGFIHRALETLLENPH